MKKIYSKQQLCWVVSFFSIHIFDWVIQITRHPTAILQANVYILSLLMSLMLFYVIGLLHHSIPNRLQKISAFIISFLLTLLITAHFFVYREFGDSFSYSMLNFAAENPNYLLSFSKTYLLNIGSPLVLFLFIFYFWLWYPNPKVPQETTPLPKLTIWLSIVFLFHLIILRLLSFDVLERKLSPDIAFIFASYNFARDNTSEQKKLWLHASHRIKPDVLPATKKTKYNVLIVINESWGKKGVWLYNGQNNCMPNLKNWIEDENSNFAIFRNAFSNASATAISVPSILTGVAPWESSQKLHSMPFLWDWAKSAGYRTLFVSSQYYKWANFDNFFFCPGPENRYTADLTELKQANDFGVDDIAMSNYFEEGIKKDTSKPFFAILQTNALHCPFQQKCDSLKQPICFPSAYENALYILDADFKRIKEILHTYNKLDNTFVIFTADHGDTDSPIHKPGRIVSYYDEIISIPFIVLTPKKWILEHPELYKNLQRNTNYNIANIDIAPTVANILGYTDKNKTFQKFAGKSLLHKVDSTRIFYALNTNETRTWREEGFAIIHQKNRLIYTTKEGRMFFNTAVDTNELRNDIRTLSPSEQGFYNKLISNNPELSRIEKKIPKM